MRLYRHKRPWWEYLVVGVLIAASMLMGVGLYARRDRLFKERLLILELEGMRRQVVAHMLEKRAVPKIPPWGESGPAASGAAPRLDPFGTSYDYNPETGRVNSQTEGYGSW